MPRPEIHVFEGVGDSMPAQLDVRVSPRFIEENLRNTSVTLPRAISLSALRGRIMRCHFLNTSFSVSFWPDSNVPVVDSVICCPSAETTHVSF
jgi:hypothetical protein